MIATAILCLLVEPADLVRQLRSDDAAVRLRAVQQVERQGADGLPDEAYLAPLAKLLADPDAQTRGLAALALSRHVVACKGKVPEGVVAPLLLGLRDENPHLAAYCERSLLSLRERTLPQLRAALATDQPREQRLAALEGCLSLARLRSCRESIEVIFWRVLLDRDPVVCGRAVVLHGLIQAEYALPHISDVQLLIAALRAEEEQVRALAVRHLAALEENALPGLLDLLDDRNAIVQAEAVKLVARLLDGKLTLTPGQREKLVRYLTRPEPATPDPIRTVVFRVTDPTVWLEAPRFDLRLSLVVRLLPTPPPAPEPADPLLGLASALALVPQPSDLFELLRSEDPAERRAAVERVERLGTEGAITPLYVPVLASLLGDPDTKTSSLAGRALLHHLSAWVDGEPAFVRRALSLSSIHDPVLVDMVRQANAAVRLANGENAVKGALFLRKVALAAGSRIPEDALEGLRWGCKSDDASVRRACIEGLAACGPRATHTLGELLDDLSPSARRGALGAIALLIQSRQPIDPGVVARVRKLLNSPDTVLVQMARTVLAEVDRKPLP
jgi:HEAT repeat protein